MKKKTVKVKSSRMPLPTHEHGYTYKEIKTFLTKKELKEFNEWIVGQTGMVEPDGEFVTYTHDVERFVRLVRNGTPTYFD